jgi:hypothetical protein
MRCHHVLCLRAACAQTVRFFVNDTRTSLAHFADVIDEDMWLIYNDRVVFSGRHLHEEVRVGRCVRHLRSRIGQRHCRARHVLTPLHACSVGNGHTMHTHTHNAGPRVGGASTRVPSVARVRGAAG